MAAVRPDCWLLTAPNPALNRDAVKHRTLFHHLARRALAPR